MFHVPCYSSALPLFLIGLSFPMFYYAAEKSDPSEIDVKTIVFLMVICMGFIFIVFGSLFMTGSKIQPEKYPKNRFEKNRTYMIRCYKYMLMFLIVCSIGGSFLITTMKHTFVFLSCTNLSILICLLMFINEVNVVKIFYLKNLKEVFFCLFIHIVSFIAGAYLFDDTSPEVYIAKMTFFRVNIFYLFLINLDLYLFYKYQFKIGDLVPERSAVYHVNVETASNPAVNLSNGEDLITGGPMSEEIDVGY